MPNPRQSICHALLHFVGAALASCGTMERDDGIPVLTPSELDRRAVEFDGKLARVRGWFAIGRIERCIWDSKAAKEQADRAAPRDTGYQAHVVSVVAPDTPQVRAKANRMVTLEGTFYRHRKTAA